MILFEIFLLAFLRFVCQLFMNKKFYQKFKAKYNGIKSLPYFVYDYLVFENAYRNAKKDNYHYRYLKLVHNLMILNLMILIVLPLFYLVPNKDAFLFGVVGYSVVLEIVGIQVFYRKNYKKKNQ